MHRAATRATRFQNSHLRRNSKSASRRPRSGEKGVDINSRPQYLLRRHSNRDCLTSQWSVMVFEARLRRPEAAIRQSRKRHAALENDVALKGAFARDLMSRTTMVAARLPGDNAADVLPRPIRDCDVARVQRYLQELGLPRIGREVINDAMNCVPMIPNASTQGLVVQARLG